MAADLLLKAPMEYEPLKKNRFLVRFPSDLGIQEWWVQSVGRPHLTQNATEIPFLNTSAWTLGRYVWDTISLTIRDFIGPSSSQACMEWVRLHSESASGRQGYAAAYKRDLLIEILDPTGVAVSQWLIKNAFITEINFGDMQYDDDGLATIDLTLRPDYCILSY